MKRIFNILATLVVLNLCLAKELDNTHRLAVFFTNDLHGGIVPQKAEFLNPEFPPMLGGGPSAAAIINNVREKAKTEGFQSSTTCGKKRKPKDFPPC
jgi:2',3'-cyclic-nucleotide 2'-phosphodiesterase (5'-nucleotidase family)